jgi:hypothetical protein
LFGIARSAGTAEPLLPEAVPVEGEPFRATIATVDAQWRVTFRREGRDSTMPITDLLFWGAWVEAERAPHVVLADGGHLIADVVSADKETLVADSPTLGEIRLPVALAAGVVFRPPAERLRRDRLSDRLVRASGDSDRVMLVNGDELGGTIDTIAKGRLKLHTDVGPAEIETPRVRAVVFHPALRRRVERQGPCVVVGLSDGSRLRATGLEVDQRSLRVTIAGGLAWTASPEALSAMQPLGGRVTYLSDLQPAEYRHVPYLDLKWPYCADRNVQGGMLRSGGRLYLKGLGVHSAARLTYLLAEPYRRFEAALAVDDETLGKGSVGFRVFVDGRPRYASPPIRGGQAPVPISVELDGGKRLDLVVDFAERADELDHADWLNARLVR